MKLGMKMRDGRTGLKGELIRLTATVGTLMDDAGDRWIVPLAHLKRANGPRKVPPMLREYVADGDITHLDPEVRVCNCCECRRLLVSHRDRDRADGMPIVAGRVKGRPYCPDCIRTA